jgi:two-component system sensor histidine kinase BaeS
VSTLRGRIGLALLVFGLVTLIALGGMLWLSIRDLHQGAAQATLAELTVPYAIRGGQQIPLEVLREPGRGDRPTREVIEAFRNSFAGRRATVEFAAFVEEAQEEIDQAGISVMLVQDGQLVVRDPATGQISTVDVMLDIVMPRAGGEVVTGTTRIDGMGVVNYAVTSIRGPRAGRVLPALVLAREDDSTRLATADLIRSLTIAGLVLLVIGIPMAAGLSRSVTGPLRQLSAATGTVARGNVPEPLPVTGPIEVAEASAAFNAMAAEVGATREAQRQLLADIRHDLRTPLTVISGFSEALRDGTATGDIADRAAGAISDEAGRLERMLDDLDHLTVPGVAGPSLRLETIDSLSVAQGAIERFAAEAESREQELAIADGAVSARLTADRDALDRILGNIIANAITHAPSPGGHVTLEVGAAGHAVTLAVRDDGPGIPPAALPHVFDRFYRADASRASRGAGLGLAIVRDLAEALGGQAFAENLERGGARVGVTLPASPMSASQRRPA